MRLEINEYKKVIVYSKKIWNETEIQVKNGDEYQFEAEGEWKDLWKKTDAEGYSNFYMSLYNKLKRSQNNKWFALMGCVNKSKCFFIGKRNQITTEENGMLFCFANDVCGFYWNNSGYITLKITRKK